MHKITLVENNMGHLHIFKGIPKLDESSLSNIKTAKGKESEMYIQSEDEIESMKGLLSKKQKKDLDKGLKVVIEDVGFWMD